MTVPAVPVQVLPSPIVTVTTLFSTTGPVSIPAMPPGSVPVLIADIIPAQGGVLSELSFQFLSPASVWTVAHNLGRRPMVSVLTPGGVEMIADVVHLSTNTLQVSFDQPTAGLVSLY